jgi:hypothetical protein
MHPGPAKAPDGLWAVYLAGLGLFRYRLVRTTPGAMRSSLPSLEVLRGTAWGWVDDAREVVRHRILVAHGLVR